MNERERANERANERERKGKKHVGDEGKKSVEEERSAEERYKCLFCSRVAGCSSDMGSEHYCLRWNNHQSNLLGVFSQLLESESLVDVTLACTEGPSIRAHKVVLSACSSYFQALFLDHPNRHPIVILKDVRFAELRTLVDFMYKGEVNVEYCQLSALLKTAESLKVKGLADMTNINAAVASRDEQQQQQQQQQRQQQQHSTGPNLMQKFTEMAGASAGGDILSKGKELIFTKFGLGK